MSAWQPIETAPVDNKARVLLYVVHPADKYARNVGHPEGWDSVEVGIRFDGKWFHDTAGEPTHWQPLPEPPTPEATRG